MAFCNGRNMKLVHRMLEIYGDRVEVDKILASTFANPLDEDAPPRKYNTTYEFLRFEYWDLPEDLRKEYDEFLRYFINKVNYYNVLHGK